jgi:hypothetical protein
MEGLEDAISRRAREFDAPALVALLEERFPGRPIRFRSHPSLATQPTLVQAVDFAPDHVMVTLNVGLFSSTSPVPSYFRELLAHHRAGPALEGVLALLDDRLLRDRVAGLRPALASVRRDALALSRPASPLTVHWVLGKVYPELAVSVRRAPVRRTMPAEDLRLGRAILGYAALGGEAEVAAPGLDAVLCADESTTWSGEPWAVEAGRRLSARVFPALGGMSAHLRVLLVDREGLGRIDLDAVSLLGFDPLVRAQPPKVTILFEGRIPRDDRKVAR